MSENEKARERRKKSEREREGGGGGKIGNSLLFFIYFVCFFMPFQKWARTAGRLSSG